MTSFQQFNAIDAEEQLEKTTSDVVLLKLNNEMQETGNAIYFLVHFDSNGSSAPETQKRFDKTAPIGITMSIKDAIRTLSNFHDVTPEIILATFLNLREASNGDTAQFENSISNSVPCIVVKTYAKDGKLKSSSLIDAETGQMIPHHS